MPGSIMPSCNRRRRACRRDDVLSGGALRAGIWQDMSGATASSSLLEEALRTRRDACSTWQWQWAPAACTLPSLDAWNICGSDRPLVIVGDSLGRHMFNGLAAALSSTAAGPCRAENVSDGVPAQLRLACAASPCRNATVIWAQNDFLCAPCSGPHADMNYSSTRQQVGLQKVASWIGERWPGKRAAIVLNTGMWWIMGHRHEFVGRLHDMPSNPEPLFRRTVDGAVQIASRVASQVLMRLDSPGHDFSCVNATQPLQMVARSPLPWGRDALHVLNPLAAASCSRHAECETLDVERLSSLRPDAHAGFHKGDRFDDCFHFPCASSEPQHTYAKALAVALGS